LVGYNAIYQIKNTVARWQIYANTVAIKSKTKQLYKGLNLKQLE